MWKDINCIGFICQYTPIPLRTLEFATLIYHWMGYIYYCSIVLFLLMILCMNSTPWVFATISEQVILFIRVRGIPILGYWLWPVSHNLDFFDIVLSIWIVCCFWLIHWLVTPYHWIQQKTFYNSWLNQTCDVLLWCWLQEPSQ